MPPDVGDYNDESSWMADCVPEVLDDGTAQDQEQAVAVCMEMWRDKSVPALVTRAYSVLDVKSVDTEQRTIEGIATTPSVDRIGDVVVPEGATFTLPMPLLWQHKHDQPVGHVTVARASKDGIKIMAKFARIDEPGELKNMVDKAWQAVKARLVRGLSIGFSPTEWEPFENGYKFTKWAWHELSLVTIPANEDASISVIKSIDQQLRAATGREESHVEVSRPGASGKSRNSKPVELTAMAEKKTLAEQITALEAARQAKSARMTEVMQTSMDEGRSTDEAEQEEFDTLQREVDSIDGDLKRLHQLESINRAQAKPVQAQDVKTLEDGSAARAGMIRVAPVPLPKGIRFARAVRAIGLSYVQRRDVSMMAQALYPDDPLVQKAAVAAGTTSADSWTGALVSEEGAVFADFLEFLRPMTILGKFGVGGVPSLRNVPFRVPLGTQTGGGAGYWVGEAQGKPLTAFDFTRRTLEPLKVANIAVVTEELLRDASPSAETLLRDSLAAALAERQDVDFIDPAKTAVAGVSPASITNGVAAITASGTGDADDIRTDVKAVFANFLAANHAPTSGVWIMGAQTALALSLMQNTLGQAEFPGITMNGGTFLGLPVITSEYVESTTAGSPAATTSYVVLVDARSVYFADDGGISIDMSREASLEMADSGLTQSSATGSPPAPAPSTLVSLWQTNSVGFRAERTVNWLKARATAAQIIEDVAWG